MNRSIEQALLSLLPTHNTTLPQPLTELASSLLAQSRHRASTLKAEEEIARPYACAHLACDRLKITLNLPPIDPRPPIPPRIYKRLLTHLAGILPTTASTPNRNTPGGTALGSGRVRTPSSKIREQQLQATSPLANKSRGTPSRVTPSKEKSLADFRNNKQSNTTGSPSKKRTTLNQARNQNQKDTLPPWIRPTLRFLLSHIGPSQIGPIVASGLESIIIPSGKLTDDAWVLSNLVSVLGALYLYVWRGVTWPGGQDIDRERYVKFRKEVAACLRRARDEVELKTPEKGEDEEEEDPWEGWGEAGPREFDAAAVRGSRHGWFQMEWVEGVGDLVGRGRDAQDERERDKRGGEGEVVQIRRADTMFQERYDYLGERKRKAYAEWKGGIVKRIKELEAR